MAEGRLAPWYHPFSPPQNAKGSFASAVSGEARSASRAKMRCLLAAAAREPCSAHIPCRLAPTAGSLKGAFGVLFPSSRYEYIEFTHRIYVCQGKYAGQGCFVIRLQILSLYHGFASVQPESLAGYAGVFGPHALCRLPRQREALVMHRQLNIPPSLVRFRVINF